MRNWKKLPLCAAAGAVALGSIAHAVPTVLYETQFETPPFTPGQLQATTFGAGQNGWFVDGDVTKFLIAGGTGTNTSQVLRANPNTAGAGGGWAWWDPLDISPVAANQQLITVEWSQYVASGANRSGGFGIDMFSSVTEYITSVQVASDNSIRATAADSQFINTGVTAVRDSWHDFKMVMNWSNNTYDLFFNNTLIADNYGFNPRNGAIGDVDFRHNQQIAANDFGMFDNLRITSDVLPIATPTWNVDAGGNWNVAGSWSTLTIPNGPAAKAILGNVITAPRSIQCDFVVTLDQLTFDSNVTYTVGGLPDFSGPGLILAGSTSLAVDVKRGSHEILTPTRIDKNALINVDATGTLRFRNTFDMTGRTITKTGDGTLRIRQARGGAIYVQDGVLETTGGGTFTGTSNVTSLIIDAGAMLNIANQAFCINYSGSSPVDIIRQYALNQRIVDFTIVRPDVGIGYAEAGAIGMLNVDDVALDSTSIIITSAIFGDTNLSNIVNFDDLLALAQSYGSPGYWHQGDFDYDGIVGFDDLLALAQNYGANLLASGDVSVDPNLHQQFEQDWALARSLVPEPMTLGSLLPLASLIVRRRR